MDKTETGSLSSTTVLAKLPGHMLRRCHQIAVAIFLDECRDSELTPLQFVTLTALMNHGGLDKATIGGVVALDRTTVAVVVRNLEERRLVTCRPSEHDRRSKTIEITEAGRALAASLQGVVDRSQTRILAPLSAEEREELLRLLTKMASKNNLLSRAPHRLPRGLNE